MANNLKAKQVVFLFILSINQMRITKHYCY